MSPSNSNFKSLKYTFFVYKAETITVITAPPMTEEENKNYFGKLIIYFFKENNCKKFWCFPEIGYSNIMGFHKICFIWNDANRHDSGSFAYFTILNSYLLNIWNFIFNFNFTYESIVNVTFFYVIRDLNFIII